MPYKKEEHIQISHALTNGASTTSSTKPPHFLEHQWASEYLQNIPVMETTFNKPQQSVGKVDQYKGACIDNIEIYCFVS